MGVTGIILAGGQGRRMGGADKGLMPFQGRAMVATVIDRIRPQVDELLINANRHTQEYSAFGLPVVADAISGFAGPLAGLQAGLMTATHDLVATVPCDSPFLPHDLVSRLLNGLTSKDAELAVAVTDHQSQPVFCLCRRDLLPQLTDFLQKGGRKVDAWHSTLKLAKVLFDDEKRAFLNINTQQELDDAST